MAGFKTHLTVSTLMGVGYGGAAYYMYHVPVPTCVLAGGLCAVSGMLPDVDSDSGRPLHESIAFAAAVVPLMLIDRLSRFELATETIILVGALAYVVIRFGAAALLKRLTVHRGMFHSLPAAVIFGEIAFLLASGDNVQLRYFKAGAVVLGYVSHLLLDEIYSLGIRRGQLAFKSSFGTAMKILGHGFLPNVVTYGLLALLTLVALKEPGWMQNVYQQHQQRASQYASQLGGRSADSNNDNKSEPQKLLEALKTEFDPTSSTR
ncbi:MAG TPA: metal-dependent hydrolase [Thermoguttaceae bacterium]|nr:metal-dependent hydrolase [Thermoguttaceae bacterium]